MPLNLTTDLTFDPGHGDPVATFGELAVEGIKWSKRKKRIEFELEYGDTVSGSWVVGAGPRKRHLVVVNIPETATDPADPQYDDLIANAKTLGGVGSLIYDELATAIFQWLIDNNHYAGTIT